MKKNGKWRRVKECGGRGPQWSKPPFWRVQREAAQRKPVPRQENHFREEMGKGEDSGSSEKSVLSEYRTGINPV